MKSLIISILIFCLSTTLLFTQSFEKDAAAWHKKAIMTCGMIKSPNPDADLIIKNISQLESGINELQNKYIDNPPLEFAKDVNWNTYLLKLKENLIVVKERIAKQEYNKAQLFCPYFCTIFGKMHKINGTTDLTDIMFSWRMEIKNTTDMFNAGNILGAKQNITKVENLYQNLLKMKVTKKNQTFENLFKSIEQFYLAWINAIKINDSKIIDENYNAFMKAFSKPYLSTL